MAVSENSTLCCHSFTSSCTVLLSFLVILSCLFCYSHSVNELPLHNTYTVSSFGYPETQVKPYDLRYIRGNWCSLQSIDDVSRNCLIKHAQSPQVADSIISTVDLPPWFSSLSVAIESDVDLDAKGLSMLSKSTLPLICFRDGSPPLPDILNSSLIEFVKSRNDPKAPVVTMLGPISNASFEGLQGSQNVQCYPMQKNITVKLTNEQISPGVWYLGLFNGIGPTRTQGKMIVRSPAYSFSANISVEGCTTSTMWGQYCNKTVDPLSCSQSDSYSLTEHISDSSIQSIGNVVSCKDLDTSCHDEGEPKVNSLEVVGMAEQLTVTAENVHTNLLNNTANATGITLMCFARHGAIPSVAFHDYSGDLNKASLTIRSPKVGRWFFTIFPANLSNELGGIQNTNMQVCYSIKWQILECPMGKAGLNCTSKRYMLQTFLRRDNSPFESYYLPIDQQTSSDSANFPLEFLPSNSSYGGDADSSWTYYLLNIPRGAAGGNIHIRLTSDVKIKYEIYVRFGGLPSLDSWEYYYANRTRNSDGSLFFMSYNSTEEKVDFYVLYVKEGTWAFGLRRLNTSSDTSNDQTSMSVSVERCPRRCSSHGECKVALDASGLTSYSFCSCDRTHGGFDCSVEIISHQGHMWQSIALIASNAAAILPAYWALRQKSFAEWVLYTSSGISSGLYHACDVGTWCALSYNVLQFMDFWLSFMAVISTFVYLTTIDEAFKRTIHTVVTILTALMAITKATRSSNIILVVAIGAIGLLVGWLMEFSTNSRPLSPSMGLCINLLSRWENIKGWVNNLIKTLSRRFRWSFILAGFAALAVAAISWKLESSESYWIWHSIWHATVYTSCFFFLCSKANVVNSEDQRPQDGAYALTHRDSFSRSI